MLKVSLFNYGLVAVPSCHPPLRCSSPLRQVSAKILSALSLPRCFQVCCLPPPTNKTAAISSSFAISSYPVTGTMTCPPPQTKVGPFSPSLSAYQPLLLPSNLSLCAMFLLTAFQTMLVCNILYLDPFTPLRACDFLSHQTALSWRLLFFLFHPGIC